MIYMIRYVLSLRTDTNTKKLQQSFEIEIKILK
ncbi:hypothetical protein J2Z44_004327, partial [Clostridium punense]|nr:hypothetical protein [Clostridium punense]